MALYGKSDAASNVSVVVVANAKLAPNTANRTALFGNTTADAFISGEKLGVFGVGANEVQASRNGAGTKIAAPGWILRKEGTGGRAGRVQNETLAFVRMSSDASDDTTVPDYEIIISTQPSNATGDISANDIVEFNVVAATAPAGGTLSYKWQKYNGSAFANLSNAGAYSNTTTAELSVLANTASNGEVYRVLITGTGGAADVYSSNATLTTVA
jgi:hypothetical protein